MIILSVDFDGTLALGNKSHITSSEPNYLLINQLKKIKEHTQTYIKIVTARGSKNKLSLQEKEKKYLHLIQEFCRTYSIPYDEISFNKEYADLYIDDMTISQNSLFNGITSDFTGNCIVFTESTVIKKCSSSLMEKEWYTIAQNIVNIPDVLFCNDETIITSRIKNNQNPSADDIINILKIFKNHQIKNFHFSTYIDNLVINRYSTQKTIDIVNDLCEYCHDGTFFHGDLSTSNVLKAENSKIYLIDPNYKYIFGSYLTDAGKAFFSHIAYNSDWDSAKKILDEFGKSVLVFAVTEGLRVCKYKEKYISIVNNIADIL